MAPHSFKIFGDMVCMGYPALLYKTTLNIVFNVTHYLELCNAGTIYYISHTLLTKAELVVWTYRTFTPLLGQTYVIN